MVEKKFKNMILWKCKILWIAKIMEIFNIKYILNEDYTIKKKRKVNIKTKNKKGISLITLVIILAAAVILTGREFKVA